MIGWHHRLVGHGFGWTPGVGDGQGGLACCSSWSHNESDMIEWLNWTYKQQITPCVPQNLHCSHFDDSHNLKNHSSPSPPWRSHTGNLLASSLPFCVSVLNEVEHFVKAPVLLAILLCWLRALSGLLKFFRVENVPLSK